MIGEASSDGFQRDTGSTGRADAIQRNSNSGSARRPHRRGTANFRRAFADVWQAFRFLIPVLILSGACYFIWLHWEGIRTFLGFAATGAIIGGVIALFLSRNSINAFSPRILFTGALVGAVLSCIIQYNMFDINLDALIESLGTIAITASGIYMMFRAVLPR